MLVEVVCEFVMLVVLVILATAGGCNIKPAYGWPGQKVMWVSWRLHHPIKASVLHTFRHTRIHEYTHTHKYTQYTQNPNIQPHVHNHAYKRTKHTDTATTNWKKFKKSNKKQAPKAGGCTRGDSGQGLPVSPLFSLSGRIRGWQGKQFKTWSLI